MKPHLDDDTFCKNIDKENEEALATLQKLVGSNEGWTFVGNNRNVSVYRKYLSAGKFVSAVDAEKGGKHACVKSSLILNATAESVFRLFTDNSRVHEYNDHIVEVKDIKTFPKLLKDGLTWTKLAWSSSPAYGPFQRRDFFSVVNYRIYPHQQPSTDIDSNTNTIDTQPQPSKYIIVNRPAYLSQCPPLPHFVRATVLLGGNLIEPVGQSQCRVTMVAQINPGGTGDHPAAAWIANRLCAWGPPTFLRKLETAARRLDNQ